MNFNTVYAVRSVDKVRSSEKQPRSPRSRWTSSRLRRPDGSGRISLSQDRMVSLQYAGELIAAFIGRAGGGVKGKISTGLVPEGLEPVRSPTVAYPFGYPRRAAPRFEQLHRQPGLPGDTLSALLLHADNFT